MALHSTLTILGALKERLAALEASAGQPAFERVEIHGSPLLSRATRELHLFKQRLCLLVPEGDSYRNESAGRVLVTRCTRRVLVVCADRDLASPQAAMTGDADTPGVLRLSELVVAELTGHSLGLPGCRVTPLRGRPLIPSEAERQDAPGREAWLLELAVESGVIKTSAGR